MRLELVLSEIPEHLRGYFEQVPESEPLEQKQLCLIPARVALALQQDGWWVRSRIIWAKGVSFCKTYSGSSMPEGVTDRPSSSYEDVYLLTKSARYFYDQDAVRERQDTADRSLFYDLAERRAIQKRGREQGAAKIAAFAQARPREADGTFTDMGKESSNPRDGYQGSLRKARPPRLLNPAGRNLRSVWLINPRPFKEAHFATFPPALVEPMIKAGTSEKGVCPECGAPWRRVTEKVDSGKTQKMADGWDTGEGAHGTIHRAGREKGEIGKPVLVSRTIGWEPSCNCPGLDGDSPWPILDMHPDGEDNWPRVPAIVLDPFSGSGTTIMVALRLGRKGIGIDISEEYCQMARKRIIEDAPLFNWEAAT